MKKKLMFAILIAPFILLQAQDEKPSDHPMFPPVKGFKLYDNTVQDFVAYQFCDENGENYVVEGQLSYYYYETDGSVDPLKILNSFSDIGKKADGKIYGDGEHQLYMVMKEGRKAIYVDLFAEDFYYTLNIVERGELKTEITAEDMLTDLTDIGKAVLFFDFKRMDCVLTEECKKTIDLVADVLKMSPELRVSIEAYTDNIGRSDFNQELSVNRATMLRNALIELGIDSERLESAGHGEDNPIADNSTVMGRAFNNRIELVRKER